MKYRGFPPFSQELSNEHIFSQGMIHRQKALVERIIKIKKGLIMLLDAGFQHGMSSMDTLETSTFGINPKHSFSIGLW